MSVEQNIESTIYNVMPPRPPTKVLSIIHPDDIINENLGRQVQTPEIEPPILPRSATEASEAQEPDPQPAEAQEPDPQPAESQEETETFIKGKFLYVKNEDTREMLVNAWNAINQLDLWDYMRCETYSYMFSGDAEIWVITKKMEELGYDGHSGASFGWTMRQMQYIAQNSEEKYRDKVISNL
jgi:hypothetical protein